MFSGSADEAECDIQTLPMDIQTIWRGRRNTSRENVQQYRARDLSIQMYPAYSF